MSKLQVRKAVPLGQTTFIVQLFLLKTLDLGKERRIRGAATTKFGVFGHSFVAI